MSALFQDVRFALRSLRSGAGFSVLAAATLALGIGAGTAVFAVVNAVVLRPLPYAEPGRLVAIWEVMEDRGQLWRVSVAAFRALRDRARSVESIAAFGSAAATLTRGPEPESVRGGWASPDYFRVLGVSPERGRLFTAEEARRRAPVVLLAHEFWASRLGSDEGVIGKPLIFDGVPHTVIGILPAGVLPSWPSTMARLTFDPASQQYWIPREPGVGGGPPPHSYVLGVVARLAPGATLPRVEAELTTIERGLHQSDPSSSGTAIRVRRLTDEAVGDVRPALLLLAGAVGFLLLIASVNVAGLQIARLERRRRELAIRSALGAGVGRLSRQIAIESFSLAMAGGLGGIVLARWILPVLVRQMPAAVPRVGLSRIDGFAMAADLGVSAFAGLLLAAITAIHAARRDALRTLRREASFSGVPARRPIRVLVAVEIGLAVLLATGAGLFSRTLARLSSVDPGFRADGALVARFSPAPDVARDRRRLAALHSALLDRLRSLSGTAAAGLAYDHPLEAHWIADAELEGNLRESFREEPTAWFRAVSDGYFAAAGVPVLAGRDFTDRDDADHPAVALVNESFARRYSPRMPVIGRTLRSSAATSWWGKDLPDRFEIVGVVRDVRFLGLSREPEPAFYLTVRQFPLAEMNVVARVRSGSADALLPAIRGILRELIPSQPVGRVATLRELYDRALGQPRVNTRLMLLFGAAAFLLATLGIYGLLTCVVSWQRRDFGIRIALGAGPGRVVRVVLGEVAVLAAIGCSAGLLAARALLPLYRNLLFGASAGDLAAWLAAPFTLVVVALAAAWLPARRATRIDPLEALRAE
jgi:putative ABC transport system permease protein